MLYNNKSYTFLQKSIVDLSLNVEVEQFFSWLWRRKSGGEDAGLCKRNFRECQIFAAGSILSKSILTNLPLGKFSV